MSQTTTIDSYNNRSHNINLLFHMQVLNQPKQRGYSEIILFIHIRTCCVMMRSRVQSVRMQARAHSVSFHILGLKTGNEHLSTAKMANINLM